MAKYSISLNWRTANGEQESRRLTARGRIATPTPDSYPNRQPPTNSMPLTIIFSHGQDGEPWGFKITAMAEVARRHGLRAESIDYRGIGDPAIRVQKLLDFCKSTEGELVLVGSSMGGHVCAAASAHVPARGMFLLAPAFFMQGYEQFTPVPAQCPIAIVHGWSDDIVPVENSIRYAKMYKAALHVLDSDHRLTASIEEICELLDQFLRRSCKRVDGRVDVQT